jgi:hypothetical protein
MGEAKRRRVREGEVMTEPEIQKIRSAIDVATSLAELHQRVATALNIPVQEAEQALHRYVRACGGQSAVKRLARAMAAGKGCDRELEVEILALTRPEQPRASVAAVRDEFLRLAERAAFTLREAEAHGFEFVLCDNDTNLETRYPPDFPREVLDPLWRAIQDDTPLICAHLLNRANRRVPINVIGAIGQRWLGALPREEWSEFLAGLSREIVDLDEIADGDEIAGGPRSGTS